MQTITRRNFLESTLRSGLALTGLGLLDPAHLGAIEPFKRAGAPRLLLSLAAYSFREYFKENNRKSGGAEPGKRIDLFQFVDYCAEHGCQGAELTSYYFPPAAGPDFLIQIKHHAFLRGTAISGTAVGNNFTLPAGPDRDYRGAAGAGAAALLAAAPTLHERAPGRSARPSATAPCPGTTLCG